MKGARKRDERGEEMRGEVGCKRFSIVFPFIVGPFYGAFRRH